MTVLPDGCLEQMARVSHAIAEIANIAPDTHQAYVGSAAFAHKAGLHASAIKVDPALYNHVDPAVVGNGMTILVTEMAGRASIELKSRELGVDLAGHPETLSAVTQQVKELEAQGWSFEAADASFELLVRDGCRASSRPAVHAGVVPGAWSSIARTARWSSEATVKLRVRGERVIATAEGNGPVNALDEALRQALTRHYPAAAGLELADYKVRILAGSHGTGRGHPGAGGDRRRARTGLDHRRRPRERRRGQLASPGRRAQLRPVQSRRKGLDLAGAGVAGGRTTPAVRARSESAVVKAAGVHFSQ